MCQKCAKKGLADRTGWCEAAAPMQEIQASFLHLSSDAPVTKEGDTILGSTFSVRRPILGSSV